LLITDSPRVDRARPRSGRAVRPHERRRLVTEVLRLDAKSIKAVLKGPAGNAHVMGWAAEEDRLGIVFIPPTATSPPSLGLVPIPPSTLLQDPLAVWRAILPRLHGSPMVPLRSTRPHFGGERVWFGCAACDRRVRILYRPAGGRAWACRTCWGLTYESRRCHRDRWFEGIDRLLRMEERIRADLCSRSWRRQARGAVALMKLSPEELAARTFPRLRGEG